MSLHCVIDIETLSLRPDALFLSIGAVMVDEGTMEIISEFDVAIDLEEETDANLDRFHIDPRTVMWWMGQSEAARAAISDGLHTIEHALLSLTEWVSEHGDLQDIRFWGNGPSMDIVILENAYREFGHLAPWMFSNVRCIRTVCENFDVRWKDHLPEGAAHDALEDAKAEAQGLIDCLRKKRALT